MAELRRLGRLFVAAGAVAVLLALPAGAQTSGIIVAANVQGGSESNSIFDTNPLHGSTRCVDVRHGVSYGIINWATGDPNNPVQSSAGQAARLAKWNSAADDYERLGHWGRGSGWFDPFRFTRGVVRYDADTFVWLSSEYMPANANNMRPPSLFQMEYRAAWFEANQPQTDDQYIQGATMVNHMVRAAARPSSVGQWCSGPPDPNVIPPPGPANVAWNGGGQTGKLQFAETLTSPPQTWSWDNDPNNPAYQYITGFESANHKMVDDIYGAEDWPPTPPGARCIGPRCRPMGRGR